MNSLDYKGGLPFKAFITIATKNSSMKIKNSIFAMPAEVPATPPKPKTAAMIATIKDEEISHQLHLIERRL